MPKREFAAKNNLLDFLKLILPKEGGVKVDMEDDIVAACLMTQGGQVKRK